MKVYGAILLIASLCLLPGCQEHPPNRVRLKFEAPNPSYKLTIAEAWIKRGDLYLLAEITQAAKGQDSKIILPVVDTIDVDAEFQEVHAYILGKTWEWGPQTYTFIKDREEFAKLIVGARPVTFTHTYHERSASTPGD